MAIERFLGLAEIGASPGRAKMKGTRGTEAVWLLLKNALSISTVDWNGNAIQ